jgi:hypothetical protein
MATLTADLHDIHAAEAAHTAEVPKALTFHQTPVAQALEEQRNDSLRRAMEGVPEYKHKDVSNEFHSAHEMGRQRGKFQIENAGRDTDADWREAHKGGKRGMIEASSQTAEEATMNTNELKGLQAAKEAGRGDVWKEAFNLGKEHAIRQAEYEGIKEMAASGVKMLAKDAVGLLTEGPVGEAMMVRDAAGISARAATIGATIAVAGAGAGAFEVAKSYVNAELDRAQESLKQSIQAAGHGVGMSQETMDSIGKSYHRAVDNVSGHVDALRAKEYAALEAGDRKTAELSQAASNMAAPITKPIDHAVETVTAPASHTLSSFLKPLEDSMGKAFDSAIAFIDPHSRDAFKQSFTALLEHRGSQSLTHEEVQQVVKELAHVDKGDKLVVENHAIHLVPAGTKMPDFPPGAMVMDADTIRQGLGIEREPASAHAPVQAAAYAQAQTPAHGMER